MKILSLCDFSGAMVRPYAEAGHECWIVDTQHGDKIEIEHFDGGGSIRRVSANVLDLVGRDGQSLCFWHKWDLVFAFPPCDAFARSGSRHWKTKGLTTLVDAIEIVNCCRIIAEQSGAPYMIENPIGTLKTYWRDANHRFEPWEFTSIEAEDNYRKSTCLWTGGGFVMPETCPDPRVRRIVNKVKKSFGQMVSKPKALTRFDEKELKHFPDDRIHKAGPGRTAESKLARKNFRSKTPTGFAKAVFAANNESLHLTEV